MTWMEEIVKLASEYGILIILAAVFIWRSMKTDKTNTEVLISLQASVVMYSETLAILRQESANTQTSLSIIQNTLATNNQAMERHDSRAEYINVDVRETLGLVKVLMKIHEEPLDR